MLQREENGCLKRMIFQLLYGDFIIFLSIVPIVHNCNVKFNINKFESSIEALYKCHMNLEKKHKIILVFLIHDTMVKDDNF